MNQFEQIQKNYHMQQERIKAAKENHSVQQTKKAQIARSLQEEIESGVKIVDDTVAHADLRETIDEASRQKIEEKRDAAIREREAGTPEKKSLFSFGKKKPAEKKPKKPLFGKAKKSVEKRPVVEASVPLNEVFSDFDFDDDIEQDDVLEQPVSKKKTRKSLFGKKKKG